METTIEELSKIYELELDKITREIKQKKPKSILLQFPEGLKPYALSITDYLEKETNVKDIRIYLGTCFGACDLPNTKADLVIQFGHAPWKNKKD